MGSRLCAIKLTNTFRQRIGINRIVAFLLLVMRVHPITGGTIKSDGDYAYMFSQEVRRFYPFVPFLPAKAKTDIQCEGHAIEKDTMIALDIYGTMHREDTFENPDDFYPERFRDWDGSPFDLIPQGGGDYYTNH